MPCPTNSTRNANSLRPAGRWCGRQLWLSLLATVVFGLCGVLLIAGFATVASSRADGSTPPPVTPPAYKLSNGTTSPVIMAPGTIYSTGSSAVQLKLADVNGDNWPDIVTANTTSDNLSTLTNLVNPDGSTGGHFSQPAILSSTGSGVTASDVAVGNLGNGKVSAVVVSNTSTITVMNSDGNGTFTPAHTYSLTGGMTANLVRLADFNGDGKLDIVVAGSVGYCEFGVNNSSAAAVLLGNGDGTFQTPSQFATGDCGGGFNNRSSTDSGLTVADLNGDGRPDIVIASDSTDTGCDCGRVYVALNNGGGSFGMSLAGSVPGMFGASISTSLAVGNISRRGIADIAVVSEPICGGTCARGVSILLGNGDGTYAAPVFVQDPNLENASGDVGALTGIALADMNGDGLPDIVTSDIGGCCGASNGFSVYLNRGDGLNGGIEAPIEIPTPNFAPTGLALADVNGDRKTDVVLNGGGSVDVLLNSTDFQFPPIGGAPNPSELYGGGGFCPTCLMKSIIHAVFGAPVDAEDGNMYHTFNDIQIPGRGLPLAFTRTYNSLAASTNGPLGYGWVDNLGANLAVSGSTAVLTEENGAQTTFTLNGSTWSAPPRDIATLTHNGDGTWTVLRHAQQTLTFNSAGQLMSMSDLNGNTLTYSYSEGQLKAVTDEAGRRLTLGYSGGHLVTVTDPNVTPNRVVSFDYDQAGNLTDVTDVNGRHTQFTYDGSHRMLTMKDPHCYATAGCPGIQNTYDDEGRVKEQSDELNRKTMFAYVGEPGTAAGGTTTITDPKGNVTVDHYEYAVKVSETRGAGTAQPATTSYLYDPATLQPVSIIDPNGHAATMTYDGKGNLLSSTDRLNRKTSYTYNDLNEPLTETDPLEVTTTMNYDAHGNLLSRSRPLTGSPDTQTVTYTHGDAAHPGDVTVMTDPAGKTWTYGYDAYGDRTSTTDPLGNKTTSTYNAIGWLLSTTSPRGNVGGANPASFTTTYTHNNFGQVTETVDPLGHKTTDEYDSDQNLTVATDANGNVTRSSYDMADEQTAVHRADGTTTQTTYWPDGAVKEQIDGAGHVTLYEYDPLGRVVSVTDPIGRTTRYGYDAAGNRTSVTDAQGRVTTTSYDAANEPTDISYSDGTTANVTGITYDADGQRTGQTDGTGTWLWTWDSLHRLTHVTEGTNGSVSYQYDLRNDPTAITYPNGKTVARGYDAAGRWISVTDWLGNTNTFGYDSNGNLTTETLPNEAGITDTSTYANDDTLSSISDKHGASTLFAANYSRDPNRQLTSDSSQPASESGYGYTALNQLCYAGSSATSCSSPPSGARQYQYDSADNLTQDGGTTQTFDAADELTTASAPPIGGGTNSGGGSSTGPAGTSTGPASWIQGFIKTSGGVPHITSGKVGFAHAATIARKHPVISAVVSTSGSGDRLLAFVTVANPAHGHEGVAGVTGGGATWTQVTSTASPAGYVAIWQARARKRLTRARISVRLRTGNVKAALATVAFDSNAVVATDASGSARSGAPHLKLTVPANAMVMALGRDKSAHGSLKPLKGQILVGHVASSGVVSWMQSVTATAGGLVTVGLASPTSFAWGLGAVAIHEQAAAKASVVHGQQFVGVAPSFAHTATSSLGSNSLTTLDSRASAARPALASDPASSALAPTTPEDGQLTFAYDAEGDRTGLVAGNGAAQTYSYNQALELTGIGPEVSYTYNGDGLRMSKTVGATTTPFTWDVASGLPLVLEDGTNAYMYGPGGLPLEQVTGNAPLWFHHDQLGSTRLLTDTIGQTVVTYAYTPYGSMSSSSGSASTPLLFAGQYRDGESGLYYLRARYYDAVTAQFLTRDPAVSSTRSPYAYVAGSPLNKTDASGLAPCASGLTSTNTCPPPPPPPSAPPIVVNGYCSTVTLGEQAVAGRYEVCTTQTPDLQGTTGGFIRACFVSNPSMTWYLQKIPSQTTCGQEYFGPLDTVYLQAPSVNGRSGYIHLITPDTRVICQADEEQGWSLSLGSPPIGGAFVPWQEPDDVPANEDG